MLKTVQQFFQRLLLGFNNNNCILNMYFKGKKIFTKKSRDNFQLFIILVEPFLSLKNYYW